MKLGEVNVDGYWPGCRKKPA